MLGVLPSPPAYSQETPSPTSGIQDQLRGTWKSVCMDLGNGTYIITTVTYDGVGRSNDKVVFFNTPGCTSPTGLVKTDPNTAYVLGKKPTKIGGMDAYDINYTITSGKLTQHGNLIKSGGPVPT
jgi:hypothetical protein